MVLEKIAHNRIENYSKNGTHINRENVEFREPVLSDTICCVQPHIWYLFNIRRMRSVDLVDVFLF